MERETIQLLRDSGGTLQQASIVAIELADAVSANLEPSELGFLTVINDAVALDRVALEERIENVESAMVTSVVTIIVFGGITFVLAVAIGIVISRSISNPIGKLRDAAIEIGKGNLDTKVEVHSKNEIGELANSFRQMTSDLKRSLEDLRRSRHRMITVQESVREQIAQQLHGSVQNKFILLLHRLKDMEKAASSREMSAELEDLQKLGGLLHDDIRSISHYLYPSILRRGLVPALQSLGDHFESAMDIEMEMDEELMRRERSNRNFISQQVKLTAYRIAEEALTNVVKHAVASKVNLSVAIGSEDSLQLRVRDDGRGFDVERTTGGDLTPKK